MNLLQLYWHEPHAVSEERMTWRKAEHAQIHYREGSYQFLRNSPTIHRHYPYLWPPIIEASSMFV
jgi:hypothetical protein